MVGTTSGDLLLDLHDLAELTFLEQPRDGRYSAAMSTMIVNNFVSEEDLFMLGGDDIS